MFEELSLFVVAYEMLYNRLMIIHVGTYLPYLLDEEQQISCPEDTQ